MHVTHDKEGVIVGVLRLYHLKVSTLGIGYDPVQLTVDYRKDTARGTVVAEGDGLIATGTEYHTRLYFLLELR